MAEYKIKSNHLSFLNYHTLFYYDDVAMPLGKLVAL
jgi:hypothetical protein